MKPETKQSVKHEAQFAAIDRTLRAYTSAPVTADRNSGSTAKMADTAADTTKVGNRHNLAATTVATIAVVFGVSTFTHASNVASNKLPSDLPPMDSLHDRPEDISAAQGRTLIAQTIAPNLPQTVANRANSGLQFAGEPSVQIEIAPPKTKTFKPVATAQPYPGSYEGDLDRQEDRFPSMSTTISFSWPTTGKITSRFGRRWGRMHKGVDIAGPVGTPILAAADGTITFSGWKSGYGKFIEIRHADGTLTRYGHNSQISVAVGQTVRQGQQIGEMGSTGRSTGSHLHFEIRPGGGSAINPMPYLPANG